MQDGPSSFRRDPRLISEEIDHLEKMISTSAKSLKVIELSKYKRVKQKLQQLKEELRAVYR